MKRPLLVLPLFALLAAGCTSFEIDRASAIRSSYAHSPDGRSWPLWTEPDFRLPPRRAAGATNALPAAVWVSQPGTGADHDSVLFTWPSGECLARDIALWRTRLPSDSGLLLSTNEAVSRALAPDFHDGAVGFWAANGDRIEIEVFARSRYQSCAGRIDGDVISFDSFEKRSQSGTSERTTFSRPWVFRRQPMPAGMPSPDWTATRFSPPRPPSPSLSESRPRPFRCGLSLAGAEGGFDVPDDADPRTFGDYDFVGIQFGLSGKAGHLAGAQFGIRAAAATASGLQAGLLTADAVGTARGIQIGGFAAAADGGFSGIQVAGLFPIAGHAPDPLGLRGSGDGSDGSASAVSRGLQAALFLPTAVELDGVQLGFAHAEAVRLRGVQACMLQSGANHLSGVQFSFFSPNAGRIDGVQLGIDAWAGEMNGLQAGLFTCAEELHGLQLGLYNRARGGAGVQLGLVNVFGPTLADARWLPLVNARF